MSPVEPVPKDYPNLSPYIIVAGADKAIAWYADVFGAEERLRLPAPGDTIGHAELAFGNALMMLADEAPEMGARGPGSIGGSPVTLSLYVPDVDAVVAKAVAAGATLDRPVSTQFYGDRAGSVTDPFGHRWHIATHVEDVPVDEMVRRNKELYGA